MCEHLMEKLTTHLVIVWLRGFSFREIMILIFVSGH